MKAGVTRFHLSNKPLFWAGIILMFIGDHDNLYGQWHDRYWISGYDYNPGMMDTMFGATYLDFFDEPVRISHNPHQSLNLKEEVGLMSDIEGNLLYYSNGMQVHNYLHEVMPGGDTIAFGDFWPRWVLSDGDLTGFPLIQGCLSLPMPQTQNFYALLYMTADIRVGLPQVSHIYSAMIDMDANSGVGQVIGKDNILVTIP